MKKLILTATILAYSFNASAVLIQPIRSNDVADFELSLVIASKSQKHKKAVAKLKASRVKSMMAKSAAPAAPLALETDAQKREIAAFERKVKEISQTQSAASSSNSELSVQESSHEEVIASNPPAPEIIVNNPVENFGSSQEQAALSLPEPPAQELPEPPPQEPVIAFEPPAPPIPEPPIVVNEHANEHANNNAQNNSSSESNSQNNSSNGSENSNAGGNGKGKK